MGTFTEVVITLRGRSIFKVEESIFFIGISVRLDLEIE